MGHRFTPHVAQNLARAGGSAIDGRTTRHVGYAMSQHARPRIDYSHLVLFSNDPAIRPPSVEDVLSRTRTTYQGRVESGEDLMVIEIGEDIAVRRPALSSR